MAIVLAFYTKLLAAAAAVLAMSWAWLGYSQPHLLAEVTGSPVLGWGPALWFLYLALRFGNPRSANRFYARSMTAAGRVLVMLFGVLSIVTMVPGALLVMAFLLPDSVASAGSLIVPGALGAAVLYAVLAYSGARSLAFREGLVRFEGEPVLEPGTTISETALRYPYRG